MFWSMTPHQAISRRSFLAVTAAAPLAAAYAKEKTIPIGLELYSVRNEMSKDLFGTVRAVAKQGYQVVEFYGPYYDWKLDYAKEVRKLLDDLGIRCNSTHNGAGNLTAEGLPHAIELNQTLGSKYIVMASAGRVVDLDGWKKVAETLTQASEKTKAVKLAVGYHNHQLEFKPLDGKRPIEVIAAGTPNDVMLQLDVGTCVDAGSDPVAWIKANPGRIKCIHCKEFAKGTGPDKGYRALFGEGDAPWKEVFKAAESKGGVEYYLIEQEGSRFSPLETTGKCLENYKKMRA
jgi:sugar phosphate isomerase/epimerase